MLNLATCSQGFVHGTCGPPNTCVCDNGWTGSSCDTGEHKIVVYNLIKVVL